MARCAECAQRWACSSPRRLSRLSGLARPVRSLGFYFHNVALRALGWRVSLRLVEIAGLNGATVIVCAILLAGLCWALVTGTRQSRVFVAVALTMGFVLSVVAATLVPNERHGGARRR